MEESKEMSEYFENVNKKIKLAYEVATKARKKGYDPEDYIDIPLARDMAERVEGLISVVAPELKGKGIPKRIKELEKKFDIGDWRVAFIIAEEVAKEKFCKFESKLKAMEIAIRTGFAYLTIGIVSAPLEGFIELKLKKTRTGQEYFSVCYAGPVRGAGGTAAATSVILADYVRIKMGYARYDPTSEEINRFFSEVTDYHERVTNLQYFPGEEEIKFLAKYLPVEISGDPTERIEVSNYKDLPRVETDFIRGGMCLVFAEGVAQKAPKLWKRLSVWGKEMGLNWDFLKEFLEIQKRVKAKGKVEKKLTPNYTYLKDLVAGRPVLTHPMRNGGFRLRYGRCRVSGFSAASIHPVTMFLLNKYIATGTQLKVERPGKAAAITPCDSIEPPIVKLKNGNVVKLKTLKDVKEYFSEVEEILFLGDILFNYGDFSENGHIFIPSGYCQEYWIQEFEKSIVNYFGNIDIIKLSELTEIPEEKIEEILSNPLNHKISVSNAINLSKKLNIPLHPYYIYYWNSINKDQLLTLINSIEMINIKKEDEKIKKVIFPYNVKLKRIFELIGLPHILASNEFIVIEKDHSIAFLYNLGLENKFNKKKLLEIVDDKDNVLEMINLLSNLKIRDKCGVFVGARMGRPEKAKMRKLTGSPQVLFPVGKEGGRLRCFQSALEQGVIRGDFPLYKCTHCNKNTIYPICEICDKKTKKLFYCSVCGEIENKVCKKHGNAYTYKTRDINIKHYFEKALKKMGIRTYPDLIKGVRGTSNKDHIPENLIKGIIRAKHGIYVNKDGTTRYDISELPITHFKPEEIGTNVGKLNELGYTHDITGAPLVNKNQVVELKPQDLILPCNKETVDEPADLVLFNVSKFIDELLVSLYGLKPFYNLIKPSDLVGHLVIGLAPHISAGLIGRIIGFSETQGCFAHPLWHAGLRRDCDGDECCVMMLMDALLNFSRQFLPDKRGGRTMDAPLVLTSKLIPTEVDDQVHGIDVVWKYHLEFYEKCKKYVSSKDVVIEQLNKRLNTEKQYEKIGFTHNVSNINMGVNCSAYKILPSMQEKLQGQMQIAQKIRAVDTADVARLVIEKHFIKDIKGNLRKFSMQQFRCVKCNEKYRRPPLIGKCTACGGKIIFTISKGSIVKYLEPSINLAEEFNSPVYLKQTLNLIKSRVEEVFGKEKEKQEGLVKWFGN